jgi:hypothetical protein
VNSSTKSIYEKKYNSLFCVTYLLQKILIKVFSGKRHAEDFFYLFIQAVLKRILLSKNNLTIFDYLSVITLMGA